LQVLKQLTEPMSLVTVPDDPPVSVTVTARVKVGAGTAQQNKRSNRLQGV
jgi:hypothetical protein